MRFVWKSGESPRVVTCPKHLVSRQKSPSTKTDKQEGVQAPREEPPTLGADAQAHGPLRASPHPPWTEGTRQPCPPTTPCL